MSLDTDARATAIYNAIKGANANFTKLSGGDADVGSLPDGSEAAALLANLKTVFGADLGYLVANTVVSPASMVVPASSIVTAGSPSTQTGPPAPVPIDGTGTIG